MDPMTAISLASSIIAFVDFGIEVVKQAAEIYSSASGATEESRSAEVVVAQMRVFAARLQLQPVATKDGVVVTVLSADEEALRALATECDALARQIIALVEKVRPKDRKSMLASLGASLKAKHYEGERRRLEERLGNCRAQLALQLNYLTSSKMKSQLDSLVVSAKEQSSNIERLSHNVAQLCTRNAVMPLTPLAQAQLRALEDMTDHMSDRIAEQDILNALKFQEMYGRYEMVDNAHFQTLHWIYADLEISPEGDTDTDSVGTTGSISAHSLDAEISQIQATGEKVIANDVSSDEVDENKASEEARDVGTEETGKQNDENYHERDGRDPTNDSDDEWSDWESETPGEIAENIAMGQVGESENNDDSYGEETDDLVEQGSPEKPINKVIEADDVNDDISTKKPEDNGDTQGIGYETGAKNEAAMVESNSTDSDSVSNPSPRPTQALNPRKEAARDALISWLVSGEGIFHISGKLGSGKSTLMKYLCDQEATKALLRKWAGDHQLVFASFFFWKPGTMLQKSMRGLSRSLLHDVLVKAPELIRHVLPEMWTEAKARTMLCQTNTKLSVSDKVLQDAFGRLNFNADLYKRHCFCFFIDGLDEYEGGNQEDSKSLVENLSGWTKAFPKTIKFCVSSREYNVFMNAFNPSNRIRLHELTLQDMTNYVSNKLNHVGPEDKITNLINEIVKNADGIFLWVVLVVKRMREQVENGWDIADLNREITKLPRELDGLLSLLLDTLDDSDQRVAYQAFAMVQKWADIESCSGDIEGGPTLLAFSFWEEYAQDPLFATRPTFAHAALSQSAIDLRTDSARKRLNGYSKGLLEAETNKTPRTVRGQIRFTHRSVPEFMAKKAKQEPAYRYLEGFDVIDALTQLRLAELRADSATVLNLEDLGWVIAVRCDSHLDKPPFSFLESFSDALEIIPAKNKSIKYDTLHSQTTLMRIFHPVDNEWPHASFSSSVASCLKAGPLACARAKEPMHPVYSTLLHGNFEYFRWKMIHEPDIRVWLRPEILLYCIIRSELPFDPAAMDAVDFLFAHGLEPSTETEISILPLSAVTLDPLKKWQETHLTMALWHILLLETFHMFHLYGTKVQMQRLGLVLEKCLRRGVDPFFEFMARQNKNKRRAEYKLFVGREKRPIRIHSRYDFRHLSSAGFENTRVCSLGEYLALFEFANEKELLQLAEDRTQACSDTGPHRDSADRTTSQQPDALALDKSQDPLDLVDTIKLEKTVEEIGSETGQTTMPSTRNETNSLTTALLIVSLILVIMSYMAMKMLA